MNCEIEIVESIENYKTIFNGAYNPLREKVKLIIDDIMIRVSKRIWYDTVVYIYYVLKYKLFFFVFISIEKRNISPVLFLPNYIRQYSMITKHHNPVWDRKKKILIFIDNNSTSNIYIYYIFIQSKEVYVLPLVCRICKLIILSSL
jgi:hypothetical protein